MGYAGFSFYEENKDKVKALEIDGGDGCVAPSAKTVQDGTYVPLGRPLFIYPSREKAQSKVVDAFVKYYVDNVNSVAKSAGFITMTSQQLSESKSEVAKLGG